jgi:phosphoglycolate phosphatase
MAIKIIVFDFDGTLVDSAQLKYDAYFELFDDSKRCVENIRSLLSEIYEESRFTIIEAILKRISTGDKRSLAAKVDQLAEQYNDIVLAGAKSCPELPGAETTLASLSKKYRLYLSSTTPEASLREIVEFRGWGGYFVDIFGYPRQKSTTLREILKQENASSRQVLIVGDGESDRKSAVENGCFFLHVGEAFSFNNLNNYIEDIRQNRIS